MILAALILAASIDPGASAKCTPSLKDEVAFRSLQARARRGSKEAQFCLGYAYESGNFTKVDVGKALEWYKRAAKPSPEWENTYNPAAASGSAPPIRPRIAGYLPGVPAAAERVLMLENKFSNSSSAKQSSERQICSSGNVVRISVQALAGQIEMQSVCGEFAKIHEERQSWVLPEGERTSGNLTSIYASDSTYHQLVTREDRGDFATVSVKKADGEICFLISTDIRQRSSLPKNYTDRYGNWIRSPDYLVDENCGFLGIRFGNKFTILSLSHSGSAEMYGITFNINNGESK